MKRFHKSLLQCKSITRESAPNNKQGSSFSALPILVSNRESSVNFFPTNYGKQRTLNLTK